MRRWSWVASHRHGFEHERGIEEAARSSNPRLGFLSGSSRPCLLVPAGVCGLTARDISWRGGAVLKEGTIVEAIKQLVRRGKGILQAMREKVRKRMDLTGRSKISNSWFREYSKLPKIHHSVVIQG